MATIGADQDGAGRFAHKPLDLNTFSIRLVEVLEPGPGNAIRCRIRNVDMAAVSSNSTTEGLPAVPPYTCLSYVWGLPDDLVYITMNDKPLAVRSNLAGFLRVASSWKVEGRTTQPKSLDEPEPLDVQCCTTSLWIDALSIDQLHVSERNQQVQQMGRIYSNATQVVSWIKGDQSVISLFDYARGIPYWAKAWGLSTMGYQENIIALRDNAYWTRAWIRQETLLASKLVFLVQDSAISRTVLVRLTQSTSSYGYAKQEELWEPITTHIHGNSSPALLMTNLWNYKDQHQCSDLRDLAYSLRSISEDGDDLRVDYDLTPTEVIRNVLAIYEPCLCFCWIALAVEAFPFHKSITPTDERLPFLTMCATRLTRWKCSYFLRSSHGNLRYMNIVPSDLSLATIEALILYPLDCACDWKPQMRHPDPFGQLALAWGAKSHEHTDAWYLAWKRPQASMDSVWELLPNDTFTVEEGDGPEVTLHLSVGAALKIQAVLNLDILGPYIARAVIRKRPGITSTLSWKVAKHPIVC